MIDQIMVSSIVPKNIVQLQDLTMSQCKEIVAAKAGN